MIMPSPHIAIHPSHSAMMSMTSLSNHEERSAAFDQLQLCIDRLSVVPANLSLRPVELNPMAQIHGSQSPA